MTFEDNDPKIESDTGEIFLTDKKLLQMLQEILK